MVNQENLLKEIKSLSDSIRQKNRALKLGISEREKFLETTFKPVTKPLKRIAQNIGKSSIPFDGDVILPISKYEEEFQDEDYRGMSTTEEESQDSDATEESEETDVLRDKGEISAEEKKESTKSSEEEEEETINPSNLSKLGIDIVNKGKLGRKYLLKFLHSSQANRKYHSYGARLEEDGIMIGNSKLDVNDNDNILINNKIFKGTKGLFELIFKNKPEKIYTNKDLSIFKQILDNTNAHKRGYSKSSPVYRNKSIKYTDIISQLYPPLGKRAPIKRRAVSSAEINILHKKRRPSGSTSTGSGLLKNLYNTNIIYYNDVNKLVDRMRLLHEAIEAGHSGLNNEWVALVEELRNRGIIA